MIKEIAKIIENQDIMTGAVIKLDENGNLSPSLVSIKVDTFVEDDFHAEKSLIENIVKECIEKNNTANTELTRQRPEDVSMVEHCSYLIEESYTLAQQLMYKNTRMFIPNYVICSGDIYSLFEFVKDYELCPTDDIEGTYKAGMLRNIAVFVSPILDKGQMLWGVNSDTSPSIVTFKNEDDKICNKIVNGDCFVLVNIED